MRYAAFISYNHRDRKAAGWLHRALETYRIPKRLRGRVSAVGLLGARLPPIFQDREELAASSDLAASVREALDQAASLIVICSPNGARSHWVNEEIRAFTALGRRDRIQCLIVDGIPNASRTTGADPDQECLPPALFEHGGQEPLASDIRAGQDGRGSAKLKLLAGIMGLPYDELRRREHARRQKQLALLAGVSAIGFVLMTGLAVSALISRQEAIAQRDLARRKTITAERTVDFVKSMFAVADPSESRGNTITAREVLDRGTERIDHELSGEPSVKADIGTTLGEVYTGLGLLHKSDAIIQRMLTLSGVDTGTRARQYLALADVRIWQADDEGALHSFQNALDLARAPQSERQDLIPRILSGMSEARTSIGGQDALAEQEARTALAMDRKRGQTGVVDVARDLEALGQNLFLTERQVEARSAFGEALAIRVRMQGASHPIAIQDLNQLGTIAYMQHDAPTAEKYFREVLPLREHVLGRQHPEVATSLNNLARLLIERRAYAEAVALLRRAVEIELAQRDSGTGDLAFIYGNLGLALRGTDHVDEATTYLKKARAVAVAQKHRNLAPILTDLADIACDRSEIARGNALLDQAAPIMAKTYSDDPWRSAWVDVIRARCLTASGQKRAAAALLRSAAPIVSKRWPPETHYGARLRQISASADR